MPDDPDVSDFSDDDLKLLAETQKQFPTTPLPELLQQFRAARGSVTPSGPSGQSPPAAKSPDYDPPFPGKPDEPYINLVRLLGNAPYAALHRGVLPFVPGTKEAQGMGEGLIGLGKAAVPGTQESGAMGQALMGMPAEILERLKHPRQTITDLSMRAVNDPFSTAMDMTFLLPPAMRAAAMAARGAGRLQAGGEAERALEAARLAREVEAPAQAAPVAQEAAQGGLKLPEGPPSVTPVTPALETGVARGLEGTPLDRGAGPAVGQNIPLEPQPAIPGAPLRSEATPAGDQFLIPGSEKRVVPPGPIKAPEGDAGLSGLPLSLEGQEALRTEQGSLFKQGPLLEPSAPAGSTLTPTSQARLAQLQSENPMLQPQDLAKLEAQLAAQEAKLGSLPEHHRDLVLQFLEERQKLLQTFKEAQAAQIRDFGPDQPRGRSLLNIIKTEFGGANFHKAGLVGELQDISPQRYLIGALSKKAGTSPDVIVDFLKNNYPEMGIQSESDLAAAIREGGERLIKPVGASKSAVADEAAHEMNKIYSQAGELEDAIHEVYQDAQVQPPDGLFGDQTFGIRAKDFPFRALAGKLERGADYVAGADPYRMSIEGLRRLGVIPSGMRRGAQWAVSRVGHLMGGPDQEAFHQGAEAVARGEGRAFLGAATGKMPMYGERTPGTMEHLIRDATEKLTEEKQNKYQALMPTLALKDPTKPLDVALIKQDFVDRLARFHITAEKEGGNPELEALLEKLRAGGRGESKSAEAIQKILEGEGAESKEVLNFSSPEVTIRNHGEQKQLQRVLDDINEYSKHVVGGERDINIMDALKRNMWKNRLRDIGGRFKESNRLITDTHDAIRQQLGQRVAGYDELTGDYQRAQRLEDQISKKFALHQDNPAQLANALMGILSNDPRNQIGRKIVDELERVSGAPLRSQIAGFAVSPVEPSRMGGKWVQQGALVGLPLKALGAGGVVSAAPLAALIPAAILTTPRAMGMLMMGFGLPRALATHMENWATIVRRMIPPGVTPAMLKTMNVAQLVSQINAAHKPPATIPGRDSTLVSSRPLSPADVRKHILGR